MAEAKQSLQSMIRAKNSSKEHKKFEAHFRKLVALFSGEDLFKRTKLGDADLQKAIAEMVKEDKELLIKKFQDTARSLIKRKQEFDNFFKAEEQKLIAAVTEKEKSFTKEMADAFQLIEQIDQMEKNFYKTMAGLSGVEIEEEDESGASDSIDNTTEDNENAEG